MKHLIIITAIALLTCVTGIAADKSPQRHKPHRQFRAPAALTMPDALKAGDRIAIISPASTPGDQNPEKAAATLRAWGFEPVIGRQVLTKYHMYAGTITLISRPLCVPVAATAQQCCLTR